MSKIEVKVDDVVVYASEGLTVTAAPTFSGGSRAFVPVGDYKMPVAFFDGQQEKMYETQGAANGPATLALRVEAGQTGIYTVATGPARGHGYVLHTANIDGTPFPGRGGASVSSMMSIGFNGTPGADVNLDAGDHTITVALATAGGGEVGVVFNKQP